MSDASILAEVKRRLLKSAAKKAGMEAICKRVEKNLCAACGGVFGKLTKHQKTNRACEMGIGPFDWRNVELVIGDAIKAGELHVTNGYVWVPGPAPVFGEPPPEKKRKKKEKPPDPRQLELVR
jgi:hypothetical protein